MTTKKPDFMRKYFWEGQHLHESHTTEPPADASVWSKFFIRNRKYIAVLVPFIVMQTVWWICATKYDWFPLFQTRWEMCLVMVLGATVAGMTSEGGGAVAFPIMTLALKISPAVARDFSLVIQSIGMMSAAFVVLFMRIGIEKRAILFGTIGSVPGFVFGSLFIDPFLKAAEKKMLFVSIWSSFAIALYILNQQKERHTFSKITQVRVWKLLVLTLTGFVGGIFTSFAGSGVDICIFSVLTLLFRITEKTATPTTIVLMGFNSVVGVAFRVAWMNDVQPLAWDYVKVCMPVVVTLAPFGSFLGSHFHRKVLASLIYILEILAVIGFLITRPPVVLIVVGVLVMITGFFFFRFISRKGHALMEATMESEKIVEMEEQ